MTSLRDLAANAAKALSAGDPAKAQAAAIEADAQAESAVLAYNALCAALSETKVKLASASELLPQFKENGAKIRAWLAAAEKDIEMMEIRDALADQPSKRTTNDVSKEEEKLKVGLYQST